MARDLPPSRGRAAARFTSGMVSAVTGALDVAITTWTAMGEDGVAINNDELSGFGPCGVGYSLLGLGQFEEAGPPLAEALVRTQRSGNEFLHGLALTIHGMQKFLTGDPDGGMAQVERARRIQTRIGDCEGGGMALSFLAQMHFARGDNSRAMRSTANPNRLPRS